MSAATGERPLDRTWLCSVLFAAIVHQTRQTPEVQRSWKGRFSRYVAVAVQDVHEADRYLIDTPDGAAVCFPGDPEPAMLSALRLLASLTREEPREGALRARLGIHLGPVKLARDVNGNLSGSGDGMNVGERVMSFAGENQILASRAFFEVLSCLSDRYVDLFSYSGARKDKHDRQHVLYELRPKAETAVAAPPAEAASAAALDLGAVDRIESCLSQFLGPMAHHLVRNAAAGAITPEEIIQAMLAYIPQKDDQRRFLELCGTDFITRPAADPDAVQPEPGPLAPAERFDPGLLDRLRRELAVHIGPVARFVVERTSQRARTEGELYELLAQEIPSPDERARFRAAVPARRPPTGPGAGLAGTRRG
jgi:class 3 adenylate cyclase